MNVAIVPKFEYPLSEIIRRAPVVSKDAETKLKQFIRRSDEVWFGMVDDQVAAVWGLVTPSLISNQRAYMWLLTTDLVEQHKFIFISRSQLFVEDALNRYPVLIGHVELGNTRAKRWLTWLGAEFGPIGEDGNWPFQIRRK